MSRVRKHLCMAVLTATVASLGLASAAMADGDPPPTFSRCPTGNPDVLSCMVIQSTAGFLKMNTTSVNTSNKIKIEGGLKQQADPPYAVTFVPPASGSALTAQPVAVPGGLLGIDLPFGFNMINATPVLVGNIAVDFDTYDLTLPIKIKLDNSLIGPNCSIGSASHPINLHLITGTTSPPSPNTPITGHIGDIKFPNAYVTELQGNINVDNSFSVPSAEDCGWFGGFLVNPIVNLKVGLPSSGGKNASSITSNIFLKSADDQRAGH